MQITYPTKDLCLENAINSNNPFKKKKGKGRLKQTLHQKGHTEANTTAVRMSRDGPHPQCTLELTASYQLNTRTIPPYNLTLKCLILEKRKHMLAQKSVHECLQWSYS